MQIETALARFVTQLQADGRSRHTIHQYARHVRLLARWARDVAHGRDEIEALRHEDVAAFLASQAATVRPDGHAKKATAMNCMRSSIKGFLSYLHRAGYLPCDPGRLIRRAKCSPPPPRALSEDDRRRLLATLAQASDPEGKRDYALFHLMLATGIRLGSAVALDVEDVDLDKSEILLRRTKGDRPDATILGAEIRRHLRRHLAGRTSGALFTGRSGKRVSVRHVQRRFAQWIRRAGMTQPLSPHSLRHAFAMRVYAQTGDVLVVKEALRHRSITSTLVYARVDAARLRRALA